MLHWVRQNKRMILALCLALIAGFTAGAVQAASDGPRLSIAPLGGPELTLSLSDLQAIGETRLETETPWTEGKQSFVGVTGRQLIAALKARGVADTGATVTAIANNDYQIVIPLADFDQDATLIAFSRNGAALPVRDKGPFWIVFPYDSDPKYRSNTFKAYSIWGLERLELHAQ